MTTVVALCYFHRKIGPIMFYSYPENSLDEDLSSKIASVMDKTFEEGFFTSSLGTVNCMNYYFEITSDWARGNKEMIMISIMFFDQQTTQDTELSAHSLSEDFVKRLQSNDEIFTGFYVRDLNDFDENERDEVAKNYSLLKLGVEELYWDTLEETREKTEEEQIARLLNKRHMLSTLRKLSRGTITLEDLKEWFTDKFANVNFDETIDILVEKQFIFVNQIGLVEKYVILLKEVIAKRIPPDTVIDYIDEIPELIVSLLPKIQDYFDEYDNKTKKEIKEDSFTLIQIVSDAKKYNVLSELRNRPIRKDEMPKLVSRKTLETLIETIDYLKKVDIIEEVNISDESYFVLKTNLQITTAFPEYLRKTLSKDHSKNSLNISHYK
ncbi:MAG: hypothetical protein ACFE8A_14020 [Candidatus Hodarchaeota archaeon]